MADQGGDDLRAERRARRAAPDGGDDGGGYAREPAVSGPGAWCVSPPVWPWCCSVS